MGRINQVVFDLHIKIMLPEVIYENGIWHFIMQIQSHEYVPRFLTAPNDSIYQLIAGGQRTYKLTLSRSMIKFGKNIKGISFK